MQRWSKDFIWFNYFHHPSNKKSFRDIKMGKLKYGVCIVDGEED